MQKASIEAVAYSEFFQTSKMELMKLVAADIFAKKLILEVWQSFEYA